MTTTIFASLRNFEYKVNADYFVRKLNLISDPAQLENLMNNLKNNEVPVNVNAVRDSKINVTPEASILETLAKNGFLEFKSAQKSPALLMLPSSYYFEIANIDDLATQKWKISRFTYIHQYNGEMMVRNPKALCYLIIKDPAVLNLVFQCNKVLKKETLDYANSLTGQEEAVFWMLVKAGIILPCDLNNKTLEEIDPTLQQWEFHDLLFHSTARMGRNEKPIGGTFRFKGILEQQPTVKPHLWNQEKIPLPVPNLQELFYRDITLTAALETRKSTRSHSLIPLTINQIGEFLYRTARNRYQYSSGYGEFTSRPYPSGGASYEDEIYVTVSACIGIKRGFYYYDPQQHCLCLIKEPCADMEELLNEAYQATAMTCRPQILLTIASRFNRVSWKYAAMSYATQLKHVGVIYQTMYLVATAMNIGASGLGLGNSDRFCQMTGLNYFQEGSIGEFMLGRPL
jgi:SagB-type dehydrogenase family enzyme